MNTTIFLATILGWYLVIVSVILLLRPALMRSVMIEIMGQRAFIFFIGIITLIIGLILVSTHNVWVVGWPVIITIFAWLSLITGIIRIAFPEWGIKAGEWWIKNYRYLTIIAVIYLIIGIYLLYNVYF